MSTPIIGQQFTVAEIEKAHIQAILNRFTLGTAAHILGIDQSTLYRKRIRWAAEDPKSSELGHELSRTCEQKSEAIKIPDPDQMHGAADGFPGSDFSQS